MTGATDASGFDPDTLRLFSEVLASVTLAVGAPDFALQAPRFLRAKEQLAEALGTDTAVA